MQHRMRYLGVLFVMALLGSPVLALAGTVEPIPINSPHMLSMSPAQTPISIPYGRNLVTVDGFCNPDLEYSDAISFTYNDYGGTGIAYLKHNATDVYVCVVGTVGSYPDRFFRVYLDRDNAREPWAEADDLGLQVDVQTGTRSVVQGTGSSGYTPAIATGWTAATLTDNFDAAEYRISIRLTNGWCGNDFGLAVYHHWATAVGDDYGWPSSQWYDQPQTWAEVNLDSAPCQLPVYRLYAPPVNPGSALQLAGLLEGLGGQEVLSDTTHANTPRLTVANEVREAALQQLGASGGFFAFNPSEAFGQQPRGPFDLDGARQLACQFLMLNELFPWEQTPPEATNCDLPSFLPYEVNTINMAGQSFFSGPNQIISPTVQTGVVVHVPLGLNVGDANTPQYIPLTGPGGHLSLLFTTSDPQGTEWSLDDSVPGLAALAEPWHGRTLEPISNPILIGLNQAIQQLQSQFPGRALNPGQPELAYYVGDPAVPQSLLMPVWVFPDASVEVDGETVFLRTPMVPAVQDFLPSVMITDPADGSSFMPGEVITLTGVISGGTAPYTYTWSLADGTVLEEGTSSGGAVTLATSAVPAVGREGTPISTTVELSVVDSNGAPGMDSVWLRPQVAPMVFLPLVLRNAGLAGQATAPASAGIQATYRVGVEWIQYYNGTNADLPGVPPDGNGFYNGLRNYGWSHGFKWTNNAAWEKDWRDCSLGGIDCTLGVDRAEFAYFSGHGSPARIYFGVSHDAYNFWGGNARYQIARWIAFSSCQTLRNTSIGDWFGAFQGGARILMGFQSNMADIAFGGPLQDNMRIPTFLGLIEMPWLQRTIPQAWVQTAFQMNAGRPAYLYVSGHGVDTSLDKLPKNGDPLPPNPYPIEWFHWVWWD